MCRGFLLTLICLISVAVFSCKSESKKIAPISPLEATRAEGEEIKLASFIKAECVKDLEVLEEDSMCYGRIKIDPDCLIVPEGWTSQVVEDLPEGGSEGTWEKNEYNVEVSGSGYTKDGVKYSKCVLGFKTKAEFLSTKIASFQDLIISTGGGYTVDKNQRHYEGVTYRFNGPKYQPVIAQRIGDMFSFYMGEEIDVKQHRIFISKIQDQTYVSTLTYICVGKGIRIKTGIESGWDIADTKELSEDTSIYKCVEDSCGEDYTLYGISGFTSDIKNASITDFLTTKLGSSFIYRDCSSKYHVRVKYIRKN